MDTLRIIEQKIRAQEDREKHKPEAVAIVGNPQLGFRKALIPKLEERISDEPKPLRRFCA